MRQRWQVLRHVVMVAVRLKPWRALAVLASAPLLAGITAATALSQRWLVDSAGLEHVAGVLAAVALGVAADVLAAVGDRVQGNLRIELSHHVAIHLDTEIAATAAAIPGVEHLDRPDYLDRITLVRRGTFAIAGAGWALVTTATQVISLGLSIWLLATVHPVLAFAAVLAVPPIYLGNVGRRLVQRATDETTELERVETELHQLCLDPEAAKEIRTARSGAAVSDHADALWAQALRRRARAQAGAAALQLLGWLGYTAGFCAALVLLATMVRDQRATIGDVVLVIALASQLQAQIFITVAMTTQLGEAGRAIGHYRWLMGYAADQRPRGGRPAPAALRHGITLREVGFRYPGTDRDVLAGVDLHLPAGSAVAVVGINGAGKSTLIKLLTGAYQPSAGEIQIDGVPLPDLDPAGWRERITGTFQDFVKFQFRARETVGVGDLPRAGDDAEVTRAVGSAGAAGVVARLPDGLDTPLGKVFDGAELSHGQWQRLALARGHMRDTPLLVILDEPTAALDPQAEHDLYERFVAQARATTEGQGTITVLVSHRFSTVRMADLIVVLDQGRVTEVGTHDELVAAGQSYAAHYRTQARGYLTRPSTTG